MYGLRLKIFAEERWQGTVSELARQVETRQAEQGAYVNQMRQEFAQVRDALPRGKRQRFSHRIDQSFPHMPTPKP